MKKQRTARTCRAIRIFGQGTAALALLGIFAVAARNGPPRRGGRRSSGSEYGEPPPVNDELRLVEPLGPRQAWGQMTEIDGKYATAPYDLTRQYILIGRQSGCDVILDDERASRYHAILNWDHGRAVLQDNGSLNGTLVNGQRAQGPVVLRHGDIIEILTLRYRFVYTPETGLAVMDAQPTEKIAQPPRATGAEASPVNARLTALTGPEPGRNWPIGNSLVTIGRGTDNLVILPHASVSRHHAQIMAQGNGIYIQDVGSSNGSSVNGEPLAAPRRLNDGDHIQIGDVLLVLAIAPQPARPAPLNEPATERLAATPVPAAPGGYGPPQQQPGANGWPQPQAGWPAPSQGAPQRPAPPANQPPPQTTPNRAPGPPFGPPSGPVPPGPGVPRFRPTRPNNGPGSNGQPNGPGSNGQNDR